MYVNYSVEEKNLNLFVSYDNYYIETNNFILFFYLAHECKHKCFGCKKNWCVCDCNRNYKRSQFHFLIDWNKEPCECDEEIGCDCCTCGHCNVDEFKLDYCDCKCDSNYYKYKYPLERKTMKIEDFNKIRHKYKEIRINKDIENVILLDSGYIHQMTIIKKKDDVINLRLENYLNHKIYIVSLKKDLNMGLFDECILRSEFNFKFLSLLKYTSKNKVYNSIKNNLSELKSIYIEGFYKNFLNKISNLENLFIKLYSFNSKKNIRK